MTTGPEEIAEYPRADEAHQDGIGEEDHAIPAWWWWSFFATVVFAVSLLAMMAPFWPGSNTNPVPLDSRVLLPRPLEMPFSAAGAQLDDGDGDRVFMLAAIVTREGTVSHLELVKGEGSQALTAGTADARAAVRLMDTVSRAKFEPAVMDGTTVAVNMVWMVTNTTVRASDQPTAPEPPKGKRKTA